MHRSIETNDIINRKKCEFFTIFYHHENSLRKVGVEAIIHTPEEIMEISIHLGAKNTETYLEAKLILGFIGGAMISLGYLAYVRVSASIPESMASLTSLVGASVFLSVRWSSFWRW